MRYKVILWDVDNTLLDFPYSQEYALKKCLSEIGVEADKAMVERYSAINDSWWKRLELGEVTKKELISGRFHDLFSEYGINCEDMELFCSHYQIYLGSIYRYIENSPEVLKSLKGICRQYAVTNGVTWTQLNKMKLAGLLEILDGVFISEEIGAPKPQKEFFDGVFAGIEEVAKGEVKKEEILIVGDSLSSDIKGGNNAGIATCFYNPDRKKYDTDLRIDWEISSLKEVKEIVEG
ncbi:MAG: YjjG family noncanonical pyrimidine nucleotidase [Lachnospiraceae bacterium]